MVVWVLTAPEIVLFGVLITCPLAAWLFRCFCIKAEFCFVWLYEFIIYCLVDGGGLFYSISICELMYLGPPPPLTDPLAMESVDIDLAPPFI